MLLRFIFFLILITGSAAADSRQDSINSLLHNFDVKNGEIDNLLTLRYAVNNAILESALSGLTAAKHLPVIGEDSSDLIVYEFSDYQCGYCRRMHPIITEVAASKNIKVALIEFPILGALSEKAARYALAARQQGYFEDFHNALMQSGGRLSEEKIAAVIKTLPLDRAQLEKDSASEYVSKQLEDNYKLAVLLGIKGTPAFIINEKIYRGALQQSDFIKLIEEE